MIDIKNLKKRFANFNLDVSDLGIELGSYVVILGNSGSGKSLLLEILTGLVKPDAGSVMIEGKEIIHRPINDRPFGLVFQDQALFPHMSARQNIEFPIRRKYKGQKLIDLKVNEIAKKLEAQHLLNRSPNTLSGGEKQRISLARTMITDPLCLLLDEPLSALDANLKKEIRSLLRWLNRSGQTILHVTHDYEEALSLASHIGVMSEGKLVQYGTAEKVLTQPKSSFVANFTGIHNYFKVTLMKTVNGDAQAQTESGAIVRLSSEKKHGQGYVIVPCESIFLSPNPIVSSAANQFEGVVTDVSQARFGIEVKIESELPLVARVTKSAIEKMKISEGQKIWASFKATAVQYINK